MQGLYFIGIRILCLAAVKGNNKKLTQVLVVVYLRKVRKLQAENSLLLCYCFTFIHIAAHLTP